MKHKIIYDSDCGICTYLAKWILSQDEQGQIEIVPSRDFIETSHEFGISDMMLQKSVYLISSNGKTYKKSEAVFRSLSLLREPWKSIGNFLNKRYIIIAANPFYSLIARYRGRISRLLGMDQCKL